MGFKGSLESINLADVFQNLATNGQTGTLRVHNRDRHTYIYFDRGEIRYLSRGRNKNIRLGEMLIGRGIATRKQIDQALDYQKNSDRLLGEVFVEMDIVSQDEIDQLVRSQIEEEVYELFLWDRAEFEFEDGPPPRDLFDADQQTTEVSINTATLIMEAARRLDEWETIRKLIPSTQEIYVAPPETRRLAESGSLEPLPARVSEFCDGSRDVDDVVADSYFSRFEVEEAMAEMVKRGRLRPAERHEIEGAISRCQTEGHVRRAIKLNEKLLAMDGGQDSEVRETLSKMCLEVRDYEKAAIHLGVLAQQAAEAGDEEKAVDLWEQVVDLSPRHLPARQNLARVRAEEGNKREAVGHYIKIIGAHVERGQRKRAIAACRSALAVDATHTEIRRQLIQLYLDTQNTKGAISELELLAERQIAAKNTRGAADAYRQILQIDPQNLGAREALNNVLRTTTGKRRERTLKLVRTIFLLIILAAIGAFIWHQLSLQADYHDKVAELQQMIDSSDTPRVARAKAVKELDDFVNNALLPLLIAENARAQKETWEQEARVPVVDPTTKEREALVKQAEKLWQSGRELERRGKYNDATQKYSELLNMKSMKIVARHEPFLEVAEQAAAAKQRLDNRQQRTLQFMRWYQFIHGQTPPQTPAELQARIDRYAAQMSDAAADLAAIYGEIPDGPQDTVDAVAERVRQFQQALPLEAATFDPPLKQPLRITSAPADANFLARFPSDEAGTSEQIRGNAEALVWSPVGRDVLVSAWRNGYLPKRTDNMKKISAEAQNRALHFQFRRGALWTRSVNQPIVAGPHLVLGGSHLLVGTRSDLVLLKATDGTEVTRHHLKLDYLATDLQIHGDLVLAGSQNGKVHVLRLSDDGRLVSVYADTNALKIGDGAISAPPVIKKAQLLHGEELLFAGTSDGQFHCRKMEDGAALWPAPSDLGQPIATQAVVTPALVFVADVEGKMRALRINNGHEMTNNNFELAHGRPTTLTPLDDDRILLADELGNITLFSMDTSAGQRPHAISKWPKQTPFAAPPVLAHGRIYAVGRNGRLYSLDPTSGAPPTGWQPPRDIGPVVGRPAISATHIYLAGKDGRLHSLDRHTGGEKWQYRMSEPASNPVVADGIVYVGDVAGNVHAIAELQE